MICKMVEVRDRGTCIPMLAIKLAETHNSQEHWLLKRGGWTPGSDVLLVKMTDNVEIQHDPYCWDNRRTYGNVHNWIKEHFDKIVPGQVIDVEFILGEVDRPKTSERLSQETLA